MEFHDNGDVKTAVFDDGPDRFALEYVGGTLNDSLQLLCETGPSSVNVELGDLIDALEKIAGAMGYDQTATALDDALRAYGVEILP